MTVLNITLRRENKSDCDTVERITYRAFRNAPHASGDEALLVRKLRICGAFVPELDYVSELDGSAIGNIMYTRSKVVGVQGEWETLTFGPLSVLPQYQRRGVGSALVYKTLMLAREMGFRAVLIFGHEGYYPRFGFRDASKYRITTAAGENFPAFMALPLYDGALGGVHGRLICDEVYFSLNKADSEALNTKLAEPMNIDEYIAGQPADVQSLLQSIRKAIHAAAPEAMEKISWQMPTFWQGENLIHFAAFQKHIGLYPGGKAVGVFAERLRGYHTSKGAIRLPLGKPIDYELISEIVRWRVAQATGKQ